MNLLLSKILKTKTLKHSLISFSGTIVTGVLGLAFYSFVARSVSTKDYGIFSFAVATMALLASIANIGTDTGVLRFVSENAQANPQKAKKYLNLALQIKLVIWAVLLAIGYFIVPFIVSFFWGKSELIVPLRITLVGVGGMLLSSFALSALQAYQRFGWWGAISIFSNSIRLIILLVLALINAITINTVLWTYSLVLFVLFFIASFFLLPKFFTFKIERKLIRQFLSFNMWVAVFTAIAAVGSKLDTYLLARYVDLSELGIYSVGVTLVSLVTQIVLALGSVVAPKITNIKEKSDVISYLKKIQIFTVVLAIGGVILGIPLGWILIPTIYGPAYSTGVLPFYFLLIGQAIFLVAVPAHIAVMYHFSYPKLFTYVTLLRFVSTLLLGFIFISKYGLLAAALISMFGSFIEFIVPAVWVYKKFKE